MTGDEILKQVPPSILRRAIKYLRGAMTKEDVAEIKRAHEEHGDDWWVWISTLKLPDGRVIPRGHFEFGMRVRNALRVNVGFDDVLPFEHGWEECYVPIVEIAAGIRESPLARKPDRFHERYRLARREGYGRLDSLRYAINPERRM